MKFETITKSATRFLSSKLVKKIRERLYSIYLAALLMCYGSAAFAQSSDMPWNSWLSSLACNLRGGTAVTVATIAFAVAGMGYLWGEEMSGIMKKLVNIVIAVAICIGGATIINAIATKFGVSSLSCS
jgi:type IV secretion system protein TrbC